jgi:ubiquinol-cytochrome c reductase cytochrome b subunit
MDARRLGALSLALLVLLAIPGILLALRYVPDPALAHDAVARTDAGPLRLARGAHMWAASLALVIVVVHLARSYLAGRMHAPGRGAALAGLAALALLVGAFFTGTILPWDQQGWEALEHLRAGAALVGIALPGAEPEAAPLSALFWAHVLALPVALAALLAFHLRRRGGLRADAARVGELARGAWLPTLALVATVAALAFLLPPSFGPAPLAGLQVSRPEWPFLWLVPLQDWLGRAALLALPLAFLVLAALLWRGRVASPARRRVTLLVLAGAWLLLTVVGLR